MKNEERNRSIEELIEEMDLHKEAPEEEPFRQYYFIKKARAYYQELSRQEGRPLTYCVTTFGCQMNARDSEKLSGILEEDRVCGRSRGDESGFCNFQYLYGAGKRQSESVWTTGTTGTASRKSNPHMMIALCGCMMQEAEVVENIKEKLPFCRSDFRNPQYLSNLQSYLLRHVQSRTSMVVDVWKDTDQIVEDLPVDRKYLV